MMLQKIAGYSQTIPAPKGLLRAGGPSPRRQMKSKMAPAQQSFSLFYFLSFWSPNIYFSLCVSKFSLGVLDPNFFPEAFENVL